MWSWLKRRIGIGPAVDPNHWSAILRDYISNVERAVEIVGGDLARQDAADAINRLAGFIERLECEARARYWSAGQVDRVMGLAIYLAFIGQLTGKAS